LQASSHELCFVTTNQTAGSRLRGTWHPHPSTPISSDHHQFYPQSLTCDSPPRHFLEGLRQRADGGPNLQPGRSPMCCVGKYGLHYWQTRATCESMRRRQGHIEFATQPPPSMQTVSFSRIQAHIDLTGRRRKAGSKIVQA
jgi:hypothetical protein